MGQYYIIANMDKKEFLHPHRYDNGMKLMEWSYENNYLVNTMLNLMKNKWKGDRVYVIGDYADMTVYGENDMLWHDTLEKLEAEFGVHDGDYENYPDSYSLHEVAYKTFKHIGKAKTRAEKTSVRYLYNHAKKQVVDLMDCEEDPWGYTIAPISLLLAIGNDRGGGDFHEGCRGYEHVGEWVSTSSSIEVSAKPLPGCEDYEKFIPGFYEG